MIGTVCCNFVDGDNGPMMKKAISKMLDKGQGAWCVVTACDGEANVSELKKQHEAEEKLKP
jgi:hypothetical protein